MGYGTPFVTRNDSLTGGEKFNIKHNINGLLYKESKNLHDILLDVHNNKKRYIEMGRNSKKFYENERKPENMIKGFLDAIEYVMSS